MIVKVVFFVPRNMTGYPCGSLSIYGVFYGQFMAFFARSIVKLLSALLASSVVPICKLSFTLVAFRSDDPEHSREEEAKQEEKEDWGRSG